MSLPATTSVALSGRRELIRELYFTGSSVHRIIEHLSNQGDFPDVLPYSRRFAIVSATVHELLQEATDKYKVDVGSDAPIVVYIGRQETLYTECMRLGKLELAERCTRNIAKAHGISTEEPIKIEAGDAIEALAAALREAKDRRKQETVVDAEYTEQQESTPTPPTSLPPPALRLESLGFKKAREKTT